MDFRQVCDLVIETIILLPPFVHDPTVVYVFAAEDAKMDNLVGTARLSWR